MANQDPFAALGAVPAPAPTAQQKTIGSIASTTRQPAQTNQPDDPFAALGAVPAPAPQQTKPKDTGVLAGIKRNTIGAVEGVYHALTDPATEQEKAELLQKVREQNQKGDNIPETLATDPSRATLAYHRVIDASADLLAKKGGDEIEAAKDLLSNHHYWKGGNLYLSGLTDKLLSAVPLVGPAVNAVSERAEGSLVPAVDKAGKTIPIADVPPERKDLSGAATDVAAAVAAEHAPAVLGKAASKVGAGLESIAPKSMNALLKANKEANYLYGKNPGKAFIDEKIKLPANSITYHRQLENLSGQLEQAADRLSSQIQDELSKPGVAAKQIDVVPTVENTIADAKKFIAKQTGLDVPKYVEELNKLRDNLLTRYDDQGNSLGKLTQTKLSPSEVADMKRSIGKNTDWRVNYTDPDFKLKTYLNSIRKRIYGQLADEVENAAPKGNVKELNQRLSNVIEAQGLMDKRLFAEAGTGGFGAALRHGELLGALVSALSHGMTGEAGLATAGGLVFDAARRTPVARLATARTASAAGKSLQSGLGQAAARATGATVLGAPVAAQAGAQADRSTGSRHLRLSNGNFVEVRPNDFDFEAHAQQNPHLVTDGNEAGWIRFQGSDGRTYEVHPEDVGELKKRDPGAQIIGPTNK